MPSPFDKLIADLNAADRDRERVRERDSRLHMLDLTTTLERSGFSHKRAIKSLTATIADAERFMKSSAAAEAKYQARHRAGRLADGRTQFARIVARANALAASGQISGAEGAILDAKIAAAGRRLA